MLYFGAATTTTDRAHEKAVREKERKRREKELVEERCFLILFQYIFKSIRIGYSKSSLSEVPRPQDCSIDCLIVRCNLTDMASASPDAPRIRLDADSILSVLLMDLLSPEISNIPRSISLRFSSLVSVLRLYWPFYCIPVLVVGVLYRPRWLPSLTCRPRLIVLLWPILGFKSLLRLFLKAIPKLIGRELEREVGGNGGRMWYHGSKEMELICLRAWFQEQHCQEIRRTLVSMLVAASSARSDVRFLHQW